MSTLRVDNIKSRTGSVVTVPETNTLAVTGIVSVTSTGGITNAGSLTNTGALNVTGGGTFNTTGVGTFGSLNVTNQTTFSQGVQVGGALTVTGNLTVNGTTTTIDTATLSIEDKNIGIASVTTPSNSTADGGGITIFAGTDGDKTLTWNDATPDYWALGGGYLQVPGLDVSSLLREGVNITAGKLSDNTNINLENGMVHYFTTTETTTSTPNIRYNASTSLNSVMNVGEAVSVTLITTAAAGAYSAQLTIDGGAVTENWTGGSAPSDGGSSGVDLHTYTIIKTADATFTVIATQTKTS
jgi:hypothetical protein